jgi:hypothetical protein
MNELLGLLAASMYLMSAFMRFSWSLSYYCAIVARSRLAATD